MVKKNISVGAIAPPIDPAQPLPAASTHTALPFRVASGRTLEHIIGADGHGICAVSTTPVDKGATREEWVSYRQRAVADAAFIVRSCNNFHGLLSAIEEIVDYRGGANSALEDEYVMERVNAAIAAAKKES